LPVRTNVYVDGLNLYYSALRWRFPDCRWLDVRRLAELLYPSHEIAIVKYFTARVASEPDNPGQHRRQQSYLRALDATGVEVVLGNFQTQTRWMRRERACTVPGCRTTGPKERVIYREEKGSDVNLGAHLLLDAFKGQCDFAVVATNDTDLLTPIQMARDDLGLKVGLLATSPRPATRLVSHAHSVKQIRRGALLASQLPLTLSDRRGPIHRPRSWKSKKS
jgi:uncharacterized LabA/DUF88 family protein